MDIFHMSDIIPLIGLPYPSIAGNGQQVACQGILQAVG